ncbi:unnamed protein product, partial [marine sediment metagenome]
MAELVIDIGYSCNNFCRYCQWNALNSSNKNRKEINLEDLLLDFETLTILGVHRVVLSGGEPLNSQNFHSVIKHYSNIGIPIRVMTHGIHISRSIATLISNSLKEIVVSFTSLTYEIYNEINPISQENYKNLVKGLETIAELRDRKILDFIGLNVVLTSANLSLDGVKTIINFAQTNGFDQVKFQPVFDDGYLTLNAPDLRLGKE